MQWKIYLSGEIHSSWREEIATGIQQNGLPVDIYAPVTDHEASDNCGVEILGNESDPFWKDRRGAGVNAIRTRTLIERADVVVVPWDKATPDTATMVIKKMANRAATNCN